MFSCFQIYCTLSFHIVGCIKGSSAICRNSYMIANGATTLLENWDLNATRDISDNHMMFGEIGGWFYKGLGGIFPDPENPGFKHILLRTHLIHWGN